jgi:hypothetical protein
MSRAITLLPLWTLRGPLQGDLRENGLLWEDKKWSLSVFFVLGAIETPCVRELCGVRTSDYCS